MYTKTFNHCTIIVTEVNPSIDTIGWLYNYEKGEL